MKASPVCPNCKHNQPQPISDDNQRYYCPSCKHVWMVGQEKESLENKGSMQFNGIMPAKQLVDMISKNANLPMEAQAAFVAQFTGSLFEQWYEGFKAGLLADIVHERSQHGNGETRSQQSSSDRIDPNGDRHSGEQHEQDSSAKPQAGGTSKSFDRVKERVGGVEIIRPAKLALTDNQYEKVAEAVQHFNKESVSNVEFDGTHLKINLKL